MQEEFERALSQGAAGQRSAAGQTIPETSALTRALEELDLSAYAREARSFADLALRCGHLASVLLFFDQLRSLAERVSVDGQGAGQQRRLQWMEGLTAAPGAKEASVYFLAEVEAIVAPFRGAQRTVNPIVLRARRFIDDHADEPISLSRVAGELGVARNYLSALFKRENGLTLTEYIHRVRIRRAEVLLHAGDKTLAEAAYQVGYQSYRHFYRNFVRICGQAPTAYMRDLSRRMGPRRVAPDDPGLATPTSGNPARPERV